MGKNVLPSFNIGEESILILFPLTNISFLPIYNLISFLSFSSITSPSFQVTSKPKFSPINLTGTIVLPLLIKIEVSISFFTPSKYIYFSFILIFKVENVLKTGVDKITGCSPFK